MSLEGLQLDRDTLQTAVAVPTIYGGRGMGCPSWPRYFVGLNLKEGFARSRASSYGYAECSDGGLESSRRRVDPQ